MLAFFPDYFSAELESCYFSQGAIRGAMAMYNAEHRVKLRKFTEEMINSTESPLMPEYLKHPFPMASKRCHYKSYGDLVAKNLIIYCTYHGTSSASGSINVSKIK